MCLLIQSFIIFSSLFQTRLKPSFFIEKLMRKQEWAERRSKSDLRTKASVDLTVELGTGIAF